MSKPIEGGTVVSLHYTLEDGQGELIESTEGHPPLQYLHGAGAIVPGLEQALAGKREGDAVDVAVAAQDAYGEHDARGVLQFPRDQFPDEPTPEVGQVFAMQAPDGREAPVRIVAVEGDVVTIDANHPLAGVDLHFHVLVDGVRDATEEEKEAGQPAS